MVSIFVLPFVLFLSAHAAEPAWFYPGPGSERIEIDVDDTGQGLRVQGMEVQRSGRVVARLLDPDAVAALPQVAEVQLIAPARPRRAGVVARVFPAAGVDELRLSRTLHDRADVDWAHPDLVLPMVPAQVPDDPFRVDQWHLENEGQTGLSPGVDINAETAWSVATGAGGLVAVIDSGVDPEHPDLDVTVGYDYIDRDWDSSPGSDESAPHGTACAGLAAAVGDNNTGVTGVAWESGVYSIRLIGGDTSLSDMYDAFVEAADAGAWVLSNSWSFGSDCAAFSTYATIRDALEYVEESGRDGLGAVVVASAGNGDCDISYDGFQAVSSVVSVAASNGYDHRESYSSFGDYVDITGPSGGVLTTDISGSAGYGSYDGDPDYWSGFSGTSASAPIVSGVFALMFQANPRLTAAQARQVLCETATPIDLAGDYADGVGYDESGWSPYYGCGRVDAGAAVLAVANQGPLAPVVLAPAGEASEDRVLLRWEPAVDADGDWLSYEVGWSLDGSLAGDTGQADEDSVVVPVQGTSLDLTGQVAAGDSLSWWVRAVDSWGPGDSSELQLVDVVAAPTAPVEEEPAGSCSAVGGSAALIAFLLPGLVVVRRR